MIANQRGHDRTPHRRGRWTRRVLSLLLGLSLLVLGGTTALAARTQAGPAGVYDVGIRTTEFVFRSAPEQDGRQRMSNWCWAACIQMVLSFNGIEVSQEEIVQQTFGTLVNQPAHNQQIVANLNGWGLRADGLPIQVSADPMVFSANQLIYDLTIDQPLIVGLYRGGPAGHAYLLTALRYRENPLGDEPLVESAVLRDPWPGRPSRIEVAWSEILNSQPFFARVRVSPLPSGDPPDAAVGIYMDEAPGGGLFVHEVMADSAAEQAGLEPGDLIYGLDQLPILTVEDFLALLSHKEPGDAIKLRYLREGVTHTGQGRLIAR